jgi:aminomuconate-semialdehyde/2-hydroxymuconate-6-semialdehyde dehydrogenase
MRELTHYINGEFSAFNARTLPVLEPATGAIYAQLSAGNASDAARAVAAATDAQATWGALAPAERATWLRKIADCIEARLEEFAQAESLDSGKPVFAARHIDIPRAIANFRFFANAAELYATEAHEQPGVGLHYTLRQPLGPVVCISPWNLPIYLLSWKIAPALAFGNCVVAKPSEITPLTAFMLAHVAHDIGLPAGVLNIVHGTGTGVACHLVTARAIKGISFTGSTATGSIIAQATAAQFKKLSLEMGGKNATIVFADADFELSVRESVRAAFSNQGQICLCGSRIFVEKSLMPRFREAFLAAAATFIAGDPALENTRFGALVSQAHLSKVLAAIARAHDEGGRLLLGGERLRLDGRCAEGYFLGPTVFDQLSNDCLSNQEEIFGPFATLIPFSDETNAVQLANHTIYGLATALFTSDLKRAHRMAGALESGLVWVNTWMQRDLRVPFGGMKSSGLGREGGLDAMRFFTETKSVTIAY